MVDKNDDGFQFWEDKDGGKRRTRAYDTNIDDTKVLVDVPEGTPVEVQDKKAEWCTLAIAGELGARTKAAEIDEFCDSFVFRVMRHGRPVILNGEMTELILWGIRKGLEMAYGLKEVAGLLKPDLEVGPGCVFIPREYSDKRDG